MKKLKHQHIISLYMDVDTTTNMYLVLELVRGGDLFDAITRVTRFSENQSKIMIKHLGNLAKTKTICCKVAIISYTSSFL